MSNTDRTVSFSSIEKLGDTGDIILFNSNAKWYDFLIQYFTRSNISHVGMILKNPVDIDPSLNEGLYILESCLETVPDAISDEHISGVQINKLDTVISDFILNNPNGKIYYRFLNCSRDQLFTNKIREICDSVYLKPYDKHLLDWLEAEVYVNNGIEMGNIENRHKTDTFWCSALVSYVYVKLGFLKKEIPWTLISPSEFSSTNRNSSKLEFINDCVLCHDQEINFSN